MHLIEDQQLTHFVIFTFYSLFFDLSLSLFSSDCQFWKKDVIFVLKKIEMYQLVKN